MHLKRDIYILICRYSEEHQAARIYDKVSYLLYGHDAITNFGIAAAATDPVPIPPAMLQLKARYDSVCTKQHQTGPPMATSMPFGTTAAWCGSSTSSVASSNNSANSYGLLNGNSTSCSSTLGLSDMGKPQGHSKELTELLLQPGDLAALRCEVQLAHATSAAPPATDLQWQNGSARLVPATAGFFIANSTTGSNLDMATQGTTLHQVGMDTA
jgi:hypothetical protein